MFSFERTLTEFRSLVRLLSKRHLVMLGVFALYIILKHIVFFFLEAQTVFVTGIDPALSAAGKETGIGLPQIAIVLVTIIISLDVFAKLRHPAGSIHYLTTPSGTADKFTAAWMYSGPVTILGTILTFNILHILLTAAGNMVTGLSVPIGAFEWEPTWHMIAGAFYVHSFYFLGAVFFNKNAAGKTTLILVGSSVITSIISVSILAGIILNTEWLQSLKGQNEIFQADKIDMMINTMPQSLKVILKAIEIFLYALPFACWTAAFFALKKKEA